MLHRIGLSARWRGPFTQPRLSPAARAALRATLTPCSPEIQRALIALDEHLESAEWCARRVAATRERPLRLLLREALDAERSSACAALAAVHALDPAFAHRLCRLLVPHHRTPFERGAALMRSALQRAASRNPLDAAARSERYGT
jgi:hypothetical protein